jgi:hypothetical protein
MTLKLSSHAVKMSQIVVLDCAYRTSKSNRKERITVYEMSNYTREEVSRYKYPNYMAENGRNAHWSTGY